MFDLVFYVVLGLLCAGVLAVGLATGQDWLIVLGAVALGASISTVVRAAGGPWWPRS